VAFLLVGSVFGLGLVAALMSLAADFSGCEYDGRERAAPSDADVRA
jgi:hypothetical protein